MHAFITHPIQTRAYAHIGTQIHIQLDGQIDGQPFDLALTPPPPHTHTHTHTKGERERQREERPVQNCFEIISLARIARLKEQDQSLAETLVQKLAR